MTRARALGAAWLALALLACAAEPAPVRVESPEERWQRLFASGERWSESNSDAGALYHQRALRVARELPPGDARLVRSELAFGEARRRQGRIDDARRQLVAAVEHARALEPEDPALLASALQSWALLQIMAGDLEAAEVTLAEAALLRIRRVEGHAPETAEAIVQLGEVQRRLGKLEKAASNLTEAAEIYLTYDSEYAIRVATIQHNLGLLYQEQGRYDDAEAMHRRAILVARQQANEHNPNTAIYSRGLGDLFVRTGRLDIAEGLYRYALEVLEGTVGRDNVETQITRDRLHDLSERMGRERPPGGDTFK